MAFSRHEKVVNVRTGEFAVFESQQEVTTLSGEKITLYEVQPETSGSVREAWRAEEIAPWPKPNRNVGFTQPTP